MVERGFPYWIMIIEIYWVVESPNLSSTSLTPAPKYANWGFVLSLQLRYLTTYHSARMDRMQLITHGKGRGCLNNLPGNSVLSLALKSSRACHVGTSTWPAAISLHQDIHHRMCQRPFSVADSLLSNGPGRLMVVNLTYLSSKLAAP